MAPELVEQDGVTSSTWKVRIRSDIKLELDGYKIDVYSIGILFAEISRPNQSPFKGLSSMQILRSVVFEGLRPSLPDDLPPSIEQVRVRNT
jgi:serine/threonine protein kinase